jgi:hypothetical protein
MDFKMHGATIKIHYLLYKSQSLVSDVSSRKAVILKMGFNISAAPFISYPNGDSRNFCNVCSFISVYSLSGYKRLQITIISLKIILSPDQFVWFLRH